MAKRSQAVDLEGFRGKTSSEVGSGAAIQEVARAATLEQQNRFNGLLPFIRLLGQEDDRVSADYFRVGNTVVYDASRRPRSSWFARIITGSAAESGPLHTSLVKSDQSVFITRGGETFLFGGGPVSGYSLDKISQHVVDSLTRHGLNTSEVGRNFAERLEPNDDIWFVKGDRPEQLAYEVVLPTQHGVDLAIAVGHAGEWALFIDDKVEKDPAVAEALLRHQAQERGFSIDEDLARADPMTTGV